MISMLSRSGGCCCRWAYESRIIKLLFPLRVKHPPHQKPQSAAEHEPARQTQMKGIVRRPVEIQPRQPTEAEQQESPEENLPVTSQLSRIAAHLHWGRRLYFVIISFLAHNLRVTPGC